MSNRIHIWSSSEFGPRAALKVVKPVADVPTNAPCPPLMPRGVGAAAERAGRIVAHAPEDEGAHARVRPRVEVDVQQRRRGQRPLAGRTAGAAPGTPWSACAGRPGRRSAAGSRAPGSRTGAGGVAGRAEHRLVACGFAVLGVGGGRLAGPRLIRPRRGRRQLGRGGGGCAGAPGSADGGLSGAGRRLLGRRGVRGRRSSAEDVLLAGTIAGAGLRPGGTGRRGEQCRETGGPEAPHRDLTLEPGLREQVRGQRAQVDRLDQHQRLVRLLDLVVEADLLRVPDVAPFDSLWTFFHFG